jgi:hypothetical protein
MRGESIFDLEVLLKFEAKIAKALSLVRGTFAVPIYTKNSKACFIALSFSKYEWPGIFTMYFRLYS